MMIRIRVLKFMREQVHWFLENGEIAEFEQFQDYCNQMESPGAWAGQMEVTAFASEFNVIVNLHQLGQKPLPHHPSTARESEEGFGEPRGTINIWYNVSHPISLIGQNDD
jgi:hypothetical protein